MPVKILMVDDHKIVREGLCSLVNSEPDMEVIGQAQDGREAIRLVRQLKPDVTVMDVNMPGMDGVDATRRIAKDIPGTKIIALTMYPKKSFVTEMLSAGASGYILKDDAFTELVRAINTVMTGETYLCPKAASVLVDHYVHSHHRNVSAGTVLTDRERDVLKLLAEGKPSKEIALILNISGKTTDACRRRIMQKLNVQSIAELVKYAIREGLTSLDR
ncbi:MAG: response regulator transcription factor [Planctomycetota bacterium]|jgi:DNA-binding NarL/FixJ family response regulator